MQHFQFFSRFIVVLILMQILYNCSSHKNRGDNFSNNHFIKDSLSFELCKIFGSDQGIRDMRLLKGKSGALRFSPHLDSINFYKIVDFIAQNGYPSDKLLGEKNYQHECVRSAITAVLLHTPHMLVNNENYLDFFLSEVDKGNMKRSTLALILDKYYVIRRDENGNRKLLYGSQFGYPCLKYQKESDSARARIGLPPLFDSLFIQCN